MLSPAERNGRKVGIRRAKIKKKEGSREMLRVIITKIHKRLIECLSRTSSPSSETDAGAAKASASIVCADAPLVCLGYLPLGLRRKVILRNFWLRMGLSGKLLDQAVRQIDGCGNN